MKVDPFIQAEEGAGHSVKRCCELLEVSRSAYYHRRRDEPCPRELSDAQLAVRIAAVHAESKGTYPRCMTHVVLRLCARTRMIQMWHQAKPSASGSSGNVWSSD